MKSTLAFILLLSLFMLSSCNETKYRTEIKTVDTLLSQIDSAENLYSDIDTTGFDDEGRTFKMKFNFVKDSYGHNNDTLNLKMALLISEYRDLRKPYAQFKNKLAANAKELEFSKKQLLDLRHDLEHNLLDTNFVRKMVNSETVSTHDVVAETKKLHDARQIMVIERTMIEPKIDSLITVIKNRI